jgi:crotonobetainyl-CoA:carnitine CoA-transferase CaiB-like acyl-CoA transferase
MATTRPKPLAHVRVLDLSRLLPGPMATRHLADLGATVTRILPNDDEPPSSDVIQALELLLNSGKDVVRLDLKQPDGREAFLKLAADAQVIVEGFRPGVVDRLGIGYADVRAINPRIVYCSISGYGQTGPNRLRAGHDINYMACAGVADQIGTCGGPPALPNLQIGDLLGGSQTAVMGILAGLIDAQTRGEGRYIDVSMTDSLLAHAVMPLAAQAVERGRPRGEDLLTGGAACYNYYRAKDGRYLAVGALEAKFWERLCDAVRRPDLKSRRLDPAARDELQGVFGERDSADWLRVFEGVDCCLNLVLTPEEAIQSAQAQARGLAVETEGPVRFIPFRLE